MPPSPIRLLDLPALHARNRPEIDAAIAQILDRASFIGGDAVGRFERAFATYLGARHCVGVGSGTAAITLALRAIGVAPPQQVITVAHTFVGTVEAITLNGVAPTFVDVDPKTLLIDPGQVLEALGENTRAIIAVHLYGLPAPVDHLAVLAKQHGLALLEDAAQAHGARLGGRCLGTFGTLGCFSFYPSKNLGAFGDGGAVVTDDAQLAKHVRRLANHGRDGQGVPVETGLNSRLDALQAAVLEIKLKHLDADNATRRSLVERYRIGLASVPGVTLPKAPPNAEPVWHLLPARVPDPERLRNCLQHEDIESRRYFAHPLHLQPAMAHLGLREGALPVTEELGTSLLCLPLHPTLRRDEVDRVCEVIERCSRTHGW